VAQVIRHSSYNDNLLDYDTAILRVCTDEGTWMYQDTMKSIIALIIRLWSSYIQLRCVWRCVSDIMPYSPLKINGHFGETCRLQLQGQRINRARKQPESRWKTLKMEKTYSYIRCVAFKQTCTINCSDPLIPCTPLLRSSCNVWLVTASYTRCGYKIVRLVWKIEFIFKILQINCYPLQHALPPYLYTDAYEFSIV
jgi:hypothetical protein